MAPKKAAAKPYGKIDGNFSGQILTDLSKKEWKVGKAIGSGGFGEIYLASDEHTKAVTDKANYVVKIEPFTNGPLFVEIAFYIRAAKEDMIKEWKQQHKVESLGMPHFVTSGSHEFSTQKCRFLVIPRFGQDLYKIICEKPDKKLNYKSVFAISLQILDILQYIHSKEFVHADVKASNLTLEFNPNPKKKFQQLYLLDYGLALKYVDINSQHNKYTPDNRKAHNGTLEYASRDAHIGAFSRRGDLEVLGYNMVEWLCGKLPWSREDPPEKVHKQKQTFMNNISLKKLYPEVQGLDVIEKFLKYVAGIEFEVEPNYVHCRDILRKGLPASHKGSLYLDEVCGASPTKPKKPATKRRSPDITDTVSKKKICVPVVPEDNDEPNPKRSTRTTKKVKDFNWARVLSTDPEKMVRAASSLSQQANGHDDEMNGIKPPSPIVGNPTPAMLQILSKKKENIRSPIKSKGVQPLEGTSTLTPAMKEIMMRKKKTAVSVLKQKPKPAVGASTVTSSTRSRRSKP